MTRKEILQHLSSDRREDLFAQADQVRREYCGDQIHLRGLIEFSNMCACDCCYCGLRKTNQQQERYRMPLDEIFESAQKAVSLGYGTVVLQSGDSAGYLIDDYCQLIERIKKDIGCAVTLCIGERSFDEYRALREAGADRYLLRFETSDKSLFQRLKPDSILERRLQCLEQLKLLGYQVGSGIMVGIPGQTQEILAEDILLMKALDLDMIGLGPFISHPQTPLAGNFSGTLELSLKVLAITRILTKNTHMPATTAMGTIDPHGREKALQCGANVLMPNVTPQRYRQHYQIYPNKICINEEPGDCQGCIQGMISLLGRTMADGPGHSLRQSSATVS